MQVGGVTTLDAYSVTGRVIVDGTDIGASVETIRFDRDIPSGLPGGSGFTSSTGSVTATWGNDVAERVDHPWGVNHAWPPRPQAKVEVRLSDGKTAWTQIKGVISDVSGSTRTRSISFGVRDTYRALDTLVNIPALSNSMPALTDTNVHRYIGLQSAFVTDTVLRQAGRYATPPMSQHCFVSVPMQGSTWPQRGTVLTSHKSVPDASGISFPNWETTRYGLAVHNVDATYAPYTGWGVSFDRPMEVTQELLPQDPGGAVLRIRVGSGYVGIQQGQSSIWAQYYPSSGSRVDIVSAQKRAATRVTVRFTKSGQNLYVQLRFRDADGGLSATVSGHAVIDSGDLNGEVDRVWITGTGLMGAFQAGFPQAPWRTLAYVPNAVLRCSGGGRNTLIGLPTQVNENALDLLNAQADAEFAQWWIDEHDVLQWWDRGLLAQRPVVGTLTGADHVQGLSWSHDYDSARHRIHVKYKSVFSDLRWRTNLTLWEGNGDTLSEGDDAEEFINVPNDEIWLGVDLSPVRYSRNTPNYWAINRGIKSVVGGIAVDEDGVERQTNSVIPALRRVTDDAYVVTHDITSLGADEQAALQLPSERETDTFLWVRRLGQNLPILRGKKRLTLSDVTYTSEVTGDSEAPDYTHDHGWWIQEPGYAGRTADYAAASLTQPRPKIEGLNIMPVFALQVGDHVRVTMPDVAELDITGVVTSNSVSADLDSGTASQSISILPTGITSLATRWEDFGQAHAGSTWQQWSDTTTNDTWSDFGNNPLN